MPTSHQRTTPCRSRACRCHAIKKQPNYFRPLLEIWVRMSVTRCELSDFCTREKNRRNNARCPPTGIRVSKCVWSVFERNLEICCPEFYCFMGLEVVIRAVHRHTVPELSENTNSSTNLTVWDEDSIVSVCVRQYELDRVRVMPQ